MKSINVVAAIIKKNNQYLIVQRNKNKHLGLKWEFPGGKVHDNETFKEIPKTLKAWDTIIAVNGAPINNGIDLADEMIKYKIGDNVTLMVIRDHRFKNVIIPLKVFPVPVEKMYANDRR